MSEHPGSTEELRGKMAHGLAELLAALDRLSDEQQLGPTDPAGWNVRDHLTHLASWVEGVAALLRRGDRWGAMGLAQPDGEEQDFDQINAEISDKHRGLSPAAARAWLIAAHGRIDDAIAGMSYADLEQPYDRFVAPFTGSTGRPIIAYVIGNTYEHYAEHLPWMTAIAEG
jgi:hypothetical protein